MAAPVGRPEFAGDLPEAEQQLVWSTQMAPLADLFNQPVLGAAWKHKPTSYIVGSNDRTIQPELVAQARTQTDAPDRGDILRRRRLTSGSLRRDRAGRFPPSADNHRVGPSASRRPTQRSESEDACIPRWLRGTPSRHGRVSQRLSTEMRSRFAPNTIVLAFSRWRSGARIKAKRQPAG